MPLLNSPAHSKATLGDRSISFASYSVWNSNPNDVRCASSLSSSKCRLKTYLFRSVYKDWTFSLITVHMRMVWPWYTVMCRTNFYFAFSYLFILVLFNRLLVFFPECMHHYYSYNFLHALSLRYLNMFCFIQSLLYVSALQAGQYRPLVSFLCFWVGGTNVYEIY